MCYMYDLISATFLGIFRNLLRHSADTTAQIRPRLNTVGGGGHVYPVDCTEGWLYRTHPTLLSHLADMNKDLVPHQFQYLIF